MIFFRSIHGLRGIAAMMVVFYHYGYIFSTLKVNGIGTEPTILTWGSLKTFGAAGVPIFFVISGFVIGIQRFDPGFSAMIDFIVKRIIRLVPLYWLLTLVLVALLPANPSVSSVIGSLFFIQQLRGELPIVQPGWSLEYEMFFYGMFASLVVSGLLVTRSRGVIALVACFIGILAAHFIIPENTALTFYGNPLIFEFVLGLIIARIYRFQAVVYLWPAHILLGALLFAISCLTGLSAVITQALWAGGAFFIVLGLIGSEMRGKPFLLISAEK